MQFNKNLSLVLFICYFLGVLVEIRGIFVELAKRTYGNNWPYDFTENYLNRWTGKNPDGDVEEVYNFAEKLY
jgi:hypothetical protein